MNASDFRARVPRWIESLRAATLSLGAVRGGAAVALISLGLVLRLVGLPGLGDADMEHFKAWSTLGVERGLAGVYSVPDADLLADARAHGDTVIESFNRNRTAIRFTPLHGYWRSDYIVMYPPGSVYLLYASGAAYRKASPSMANTRLFNVFVSAPMVPASALVAILIYFFLRSVDEIVARATALVYWLHPVMLLDSTFQGYNNPIFALLCVATLTALGRRRYGIAVCAATMALWTKPQGLLLMPIAAIVIARETGWRAWVRYATIGAATSVLALLPFLLSGHAIGAVLGATAAVRALGEWSVEVLSARSWNLWWPIQFVVGHVAGPDVVELPVFRARFGFNPRQLGALMMAAVWVAALWRLWVELPRQRISILLCFIAMGFAYAMLQVNVQYNQFFVFIPVLTLVCLLDGRLFAVWGVASVLGALQLLAYGGLGRDLCCLPEMLNGVGLKPPFTVFTLAASVLNVATMAWFLQGYLRSGPGPTFDRPGIE